MDAKNTRKKKQLSNDPGHDNTLAEQREIAKAGMVSSLGTLFITGLFKFKGARMLHTWAGWALLGFSVWHHILSSPKTRALSEDR